MIQACDRPGCDSMPSWAVPVFAATGMPPSSAMQQLAVPRSATPIISCVSIAAVAAEIGVFQTLGWRCSSTRPDRS